MELYRIVVALFYKDVALTGLGFVTALFYKDVAPHGAGICYGIVLQRCRPSRGWRPLPQKRRRRGISVEMEAMLFLGASMCIAAFPMLARIIHFKKLTGTTMYISRHGVKSKHSTFYHLRRKIDQE